MKLTAGMKTSEFAVTILVVLCATLLVALNKLDANAWMVAAGFTGAGYSVSRGVAKITKS